MAPCNTSMPLLMHIINAVKNGAAKGPQTNNLMSPPEPEKKMEKLQQPERPATDDLLWENKNMDIKSHMDDSGSKKSPIDNKSTSKENEKLASLNDLPPLTQKRGGLEPLDFNPKEDNNEFSDSVDKEKKNLDEVDKKLKEFENDSMKMEVDKASPDTKAHKFGSKPAKNKPTGGLDDYEDDFEDDIIEDLPVEDFDPVDNKDKNPEFGESGISASQSMGMDPSVNSLDIEEYDHVEQAVINSPFKM